MKAYRLKLTLEDSDPKIVRIVAVPSNASFADLHSIAQSVMGWGGYHLHCFRVSKTDIGPTSVNGCIDEHTVPLSDYHGKNIRYNYDFGDDWWITITWLKDIEDYDLPWPTLIEWKENSPPEDCGGICGYYDLLEILSDPGHEDYDDTVEWAGDLDFDEDDVKNSLQAWAVQGVMPDDAIIFPNMLRMLLVTAAMSMPDETMVFDIDDGMPKVVKEVVPRKSKRRSPPEGPPSVTPKTVQEDPDRYIPFLDKKEERVGRILDGFLKRHPEVDWPERDCNELTEELNDAIPDFGFDEEFFDYLLAFITEEVLEWSRRNGLYFMDEPESIVGPAEMFSRMLHSSDIDLEDPEELQRFVEEYNSSLKN